MTGTECKMSCYATDKFFIIKALVSLYGLLKDRLAAFLQAGECNYFRCRSFIRDLKSLISPRIELSIRDIRSMGRKKPTRKCANSESMQ